MTECSGCGACCDPVVLPYTLNEIRQQLPGACAEPLDREFALEHLTPISRREGLRRAPYFTAGGVTVLGAPGQPGSEFLAYSFFYECDRFDRETRQCTAYDDRPPMCSEYPHYGQPDPAKAIPLMCAFRADIGLPVEDVPVEWTTTKGTTT